MPRAIPDDYFRSGAFASAGPELLSAYTCLGCGLRLKTWGAFGEHRRVCSGFLPAADRGGGPSLFRRLTALLYASGDAVDADSPVMPLEPERDPFLDAPAAALRLLERWRRDEERRERAAALQGDAA